jgi:hypothetical protein
MRATLGDVYQIALHAVALLGVWSLTCVAVVVGASAVTGGADAWLVPGLPGLSYVAWAFVVGRWVHRATGWGALAGLWTGLGVWACLALWGWSRRHDPNVALGTPAYWALILACAAALSVLPPTLGAWYEARRERRRLIPAVPPA